MAKFCTSCGSELNPEARFCTKCGASVDFESTVQQQGYTQPIEQSYTGLYTQPVKSGGGISGSTVICIVLAAVLFLQILVVLLLGWPGFAVRGGKDRLSEKPSQISAETKIIVTMDLGSCKLIEDKAEAI